MIPPYNLGSIAIDHHPAAVGLPSGRWRGNADHYAAFFNECFIDELAQAAKIEPMSFRMQMLGGNQIGRAHVELQSLMRISYAVFCLKKKKQKITPRALNTTLTKY